MRSVALTVQNLTGRNLVANLVSDKFVTFHANGRENSSLAVSENPMRLILKKIKFPEQMIELMTQEGNLKVATVIVSQQYDYPKLKLISEKNAIDCKAALYATRVGGGNAYVIALGNSLSDVSLERVRSVQKDGKIQVYVPVREH